MIGRQLGHYRIAEKLGAGGMGEVWRATDTKLGREVAIKVLPPVFAGSPDRVARFQREAQLLASLNYPNIAAIYGLEESQGMHYLVLELVPGDTLSGLRLPVEETLRLARQIAEGMEEAHRKGIIHRDLKPGNIKVTPEGKVKILDFGLAKAFSPEPVPESLSHSPTLSVGATREGLILGTAAYMSPEQARGKGVDQRTDIWAFGCVLYELLTGRRAFGRESSSDSMAAVLRGDPDWDALPPGAPLRLLKRCLHKDPRQRLHDIADVRLEIDDALTEPVSSSRPVARSPRRVWALTFALLLGAALGATLWWRLAPPPAAPAWSATLLGGSTVAFGPRVSPDGQTLAFLALVDGLTQVAVMKPESGNWTVLTRERSRGSVNDLSWSRDGTKIYFDRFLNAPRGVYSVSILGGDERLVLEEAMAAQELPDGGLLVTRVNAERLHQLHRFWPRTARLEPLAAVAVFSGVNIPARVFADGREAVFFGRPLGPASNPIPQLYTIELASGRTRRLAPTVVSQIGDAFPLSVSADGRSVLVDLPAGNLHRIVAVPRDGSADLTTLLTLTMLPWFLDVGPDGSLYLDQLDRMGEVLRFSAAGGVPERVAASPSYSAGSVVAFPDGRLAFSSHTAGHDRLLVAAPGKDPVPLLDTPEQTTTPAALMGEREIAFLTGAGPEQRIAVASIADGRIVRRLQGAGGGISSLAASSDSRTLYYVAAGTLWGLPAADGEPRRIRPADSVTVDRRNGDLIVSLNEKDGVRLVRLPASGGPEQPIPIRGELGLSPTSLGPQAVGKDGRLAVQVTAKDQWFWSAALLDPATGRLERIPLAYQGDIPLPGWGPDGRLVALGQPLRSVLWRFQPLTKP